MWTSVPAARIDWKLCITAYWVDETIRQARLLDRQRRIDLDISPDIPILGNRDAFKQVMLILLDNALKHSRSLGSSVEKSRFGGVAGA